MKRRSFLILIWSASLLSVFRRAWSVTAVAFFRSETKPQPEPAPRPLPDSRDPEYRAHECVDRPGLPCPACLKWTGDPLAIKDNWSEATRLRKRLPRVE
jgi:hypothetical protein